MAEASKPLGWLPGTLIAAGLLLPVAGVLSGGPDIVDGVVFGVVALAAAGAILYRRAWEARQAQPKGGPGESGSIGQGGDR